MGFLAHKKILITGLLSNRSIAYGVAQACHAQGKYIGICGQGPSDHPDFALWLMEQGISSISLNPDTVVETWTVLGQHKV